VKNKNKGCGKKGYHEKKRKNKEKNNNALEK